MKAAAFTWQAPPDLAAAAQALVAGEKIIAGGQSLGPMLNLRLTRPAALLALAGLAELRGVQQTASHVSIGAAVTHSEIADGLVPDIGGNILAGIAEGIAYRAVRNRGTIGGSLCHADPAADWVCTLTALGAEAITYRAGGSGRAVWVREFIVGAIGNNQPPREILRAVRIPRLGPAARWGYFKACRKPGEFAHAMAAVLQDRPAGFCRAVVGATGGRPLIFEGAQATPDGIAETLRAGGGGLDEIGRQMQVVAARRAFARRGA